MGASIITEAPTCIKQAENGCYVLCPESVASGIVISGGPYRLLGGEDPEGMAELGVVTLTELDADQKYRDELQARWGKVWGDTLCQRYRRPGHEDHWIWNHNFYDAPVEDLQKIAALVGAKLK